MLLATKLHVPSTQPHLISRPRLIQRLCAGLSRKLTLVSAPTGFGKTTVLSEWVHGLGHAYAWLSLDAGDNDPLRFWRAIIAALQRVRPTIGQTAQAMLTSPQKLVLESVATALVNDIVANNAMARASRTPHEEPLVLVLDDYHAIDAEPIHEILT